MAKVDMYMGAWSVQNITVGGEPDVKRFMFLLILSCGSWFWSQQGEEDIAGADFAIVKANSLKWIKL